MPLGEQRRAWLNSLRELILSEKQESLIKAVSPRLQQTARRMKPCSPRSCPACMACTSPPSAWRVDETRHGAASAWRSSRSAKVVYQPSGVVRRDVPWNYPLYLAIRPADRRPWPPATGMIKMSESTPATAQVVKELLARIFPEDLVCVVPARWSVGVAFSKPAVRSPAVHRVPPASASM